jgi:hypothetical protein
MTLSLLLNVGDGATGPYVPLVDKIGSTFGSRIESVDDRISPHIPSQLPDFINSKEDLFRAFIESYYEWLEQKTNVFGRTVLLQDINDIDKTLDEYIIHFKRQFLLNFPEKLAIDISGNIVNEKTLLKNIKDFYQAKGSKKSYEFLFRILYDSACDFYYPKKDILKASDGYWIEEKAIKVTSVNGVKNFKISGTKIEQINKNTQKVTASARVYRVHQYNIGTHEVTELFLNNNVGEFRAGEQIKCTISDGTEIEEVVYGLFSDIKIINSGSSYRSGDAGVAEEGLSGDVNLLGVGGVGKVNEVSLKGEIKEAVVDNGGINYVNPVDIIFLGGDGRGTGRMYPKALVNYPGYYKNNNGKLSSNKRLQDGDYYQNYSYVLKAEVSLETYKDIVKRLIHPAGLKLFGNISILKSLKSDLPFHSEHQAYEIPIVGHYTPYRLKTTTNLRDNGVTAAAGGPGAGWSGATGNVEGGQTYGDLYFLGYNPGATQNYHCYGETGGKLIVRGNSLTAGSFHAGLQISGDTSGASGEVLSWDVYQGTGGMTHGVMHLRRTTDMQPFGFTTGGELIGVTNAAAGGTAVGGGWTAEVITILAGNGIVSESLTDGATLAGLIGHDPTNIPMGTAGTDGYTAAQEYYNATGLAVYNYWEIYQHPNIRGLSGQYVAGGWTLGIPTGMSFDRVPLKTFFKMSIGEHFHSDPETTSPYYGSPTKEYSVPYGSTSGSPNLTTI